MTSFLAWGDFLDFAWALAWYLSLNFGTGLLLGWHGILTGDWELMVMMTDGTGPKCIKKFILRNGRVQNKRPKEKNKFCRENSQ